MRTRAVLAGVPLARHLWRTPSAFAGAHPAAAVYEDAVANATTGSPPAGVRRRAQDDCRRGMIAVIVGLSSVVV